MSIKSTIMAAVASLTLGGGLAAAATVPANAATRSCGQTCVNLFSQADSSSVMDDPGGEETGAPLVTYPASGGYPGEDFTSQTAEPVSDFYLAGLVSAGVALHYGCDPGVDFATCPAGSANDWAFEIQYAPYGAPTGQCVGVGTIAAQGTVVSLQPCGVSYHTLWIASLSWLASYSPAAPLIAASDTDFTAPYVLTDDGTVNGLPFEHQLETANLVTSAGGQVSGSQLWGASFGTLAVPPLTFGTTSLPAATGGQPYSATLAAYGGAVPYTWSITAGSLPPGLTLDGSTGVISGTPDVAGTYDFTVSVTDTAIPPEGNLPGTPSMTVSRALSISVSGPVITSLRPAHGPAYGDTPITITGTGLSCPAGQAGCRVSVTFGGKPGVVEAVRPTEILMVNPPGTGTVTVTVTVGGVSSQATPVTQFTYQSFLF